MLKLTALVTDPFWLEIVPGQETQFKPVTMAMILAARAESGRAIIAAAKDAKDALYASAIAQGEGEKAFTRTLAHLGIVAWKGVGDAKGKAIEPTPDAIDAYLENWKVFDAVDRLYVNPALVRIDEKNGSSPSRRGTSGAKTQAAASAATAPKPAKPAPTP